MPATRFPAPLLIERRPQAFVRGSINQNTETHEQKRKSPPGTIERPVQSTMVNQKLDSLSPLIESPATAPQVHRPLSTVPRPQSP